MPQELHVLRCYSCKTFQVQIVKKVPKWQCKVCNEKQSVLKVYAKGSGKDCRQYVQDLNMQQGQLAEENSSVDPENHDGETYPEFKDHASFNDQPSRWSDYLDPKSDIPSSLYGNVGNDHSGQCEMPSTHNSRLSKWKNYIEEEEDCNDLSVNQYDPDFNHPSQSKKRKFDECGTLSSEYNVKFEGDFQQQTLKMFKYNTSGNISKKTALSGKLSDEKAMQQEALSKPVTNRSSKSSYIGDVDEVCADSPSNCHDVVLSSNARTSVSKYSKEATQNNREPNKTVNMVLKHKTLNEPTGPAIKTPFCTLSEDDDIDNILDF